MEIQEVKSKLSIFEVLSFYGIHPPENLEKAMIRCPFHNDKTPSMQVYPQTNTVYCFSGNCKTHGKSLDVIDFIMHQEKISKHEAILKSKGMTGEIMVKQQLNGATTPKLNHKELFKTFKTSLLQNKKSQEYLEERHLSCDKIEVGYNSNEWDQLKNCLVFPLKDRYHNVVSFYGRQISADSHSKHFYSKNRNGLYPKHPDLNTKTLVLTEAIVDAATLQTHTDYKTLSLYGTNGLTEEHKEALGSLNKLQQLILFFDGDKAGNKAAEKYSKELSVLLPKTTIKQVQTPEGEDVNSLLDGHNPSVLKNLIKDSQVLFSCGGESPQTIISSSNGGESPQTVVFSSNENLNTSNSNCYIFKNNSLEIHVLGGVGLKNLDQLRVTLKVSTIKNIHKSLRNTIDLYNFERVEKYSRTLANYLETGVSVVLSSLNELTDKLEKYRLEKLEQHKQKDEKPKIQLTYDEKQSAIEFLKKPNLLERLNNLIGETGIIGEEKTRMFLFLIALSHKMENTLHAMVQGTTGSGKSHLIKKITDLMPEENVKRFTRVSDKSFYNYGKYDLKNQLIMLEDYDGMSEDAEFAWRELQSNQVLRSSVTRKDEESEDDDFKSKERIVYGPIASLVATTHFRVYEDNESRVLTFAVDESEPQTKRVLQYMADKSSKKIDKTNEQLCVNRVQHMVTQLKPYRVLNKYSLTLPFGTKQVRRITQMLHDFIEQVTIFHQYQRQKTADSTTLITEIEDLEIAVELLFNSMVLKVDELDGILREFYEKLKEYISSIEINYEFTQREIRQQFKISKSQMQRYINELLELEYIVKTGAGQRNTFKYKIEYWDNIQKLRDDIKSHLQKQINNYK